MQQWCHRNRTDVPESPRHICRRTALTGWCVSTVSSSLSFLPNNFQVLALSSRSWLSYNYQGRYQMTPLSYDPLDFAAEFSTEMCPEGVVAVSGEKLRIFGVERLGEVFNQAALPLK